MMSHVWLKMGYKMDPFKIQSRGMRRYERLDEVALSELVELYDNMCIDCQKKTECLYHCVCCKFNTLCYDCHSQLNKSIGCSICKFMNYPHTEILSYFRHNNQISS